MKNDFRLSSPQIRAANLHINAIPLNIPLCDIQAIDTGTSLVMHIVDSMAQIILFEPDTGHAAACAPMKTTDVDFVSVTSMCPIL